MLLFEVTDEAGPLEFDAKIGSVKVPLNAVPEELDQLQARGLSLPSEVRVVYVHQLSLDREKMMDKLKLRNGYEGDTYRREMGSMIKQSVKSMMDQNPNTAHYAPAESRTALTQLQNYIRGGAKRGCVVVPVPSSSGVTKMIASELMQQYGIPSVDALLKNNTPPLSRRHLEKVYPDRDHSKVKDHADRERDLQLAKQRMDDAEEAATAPNALPATMQEFLKRQQQYKIQAERRYSRKSAMSSPQTDYGKAYYNTVTPNADAGQLKGKYVIIIDDNVVKGKTVADVITGLYAQGIAPKGIIAFAPHNFTPSEKPEAAVTV